MSVSKHKNESPLHYAKIDEYVTGVSSKNFSKGNQTFGKATRQFDPTKSNIILTNFLL